MIHRSRVLALAPAVLAVGLAVLAVGLAAPPAQAATVTVTTTSDVGPGSLREAIADALGGDTIVIPGGTYELASPLVVDKALTLVGAGARSTVLDGLGANRIFSLQAPAAQVTIVQLMMRNGRATNGGAIDAQVPMTLIDDAIVGSTAGTGDGGGIYTTAPFTLERDLIAGNAAPNGNGGGIQFAPPSPFVGTITDSTLTQNSAGDAGGGLNDFNTSTETVHLEGDSLVANTAARGGNFRAWTGTQISYHNTLIAEGSAPVGPNCAFGGGAVLTSEGYNAQDLNDPNCLMTMPTDKNAVNPELGLLQSNGGATDTLLPAARSPLVGGGDPNVCPGSDQRGVPRPQAGRCDIGAVERTTPGAGTPTAAEITRSGATLAGTAEPGFLGGAYTFRYGHTIAYGASTPPRPLLGGAGKEPVTATLGGLAPGTIYHVQLVVTTPDGTALSPDVTFLTSGAPAVPAPAISSARMSHRRFRVGARATAVAARTKRRRAPRGTEFRFTLSEPATISIAITGKASGLRRGRRCVARTRTLRRAHHGRCMMRVRPEPLTRAKVPTGSIGIPFSGRIGSRALAPGSYRAKLTARGTGGRSKPVTLAFTIVR